MTIADINAEVRDLCDADTTRYPAATLLRRVNAAYERVIGRLIMNKGPWQFDDTNYSTFPIGVQTLVANQEDYTFDSSHLIVERVEVKDSAGIWQLLKPIDRQNINIAFEEYQKTPGMPQEYDKSGSSIILKPAPAAADVTLTSGLRVYFRRTASIFTSAEVTTGTKEPGFPSPYHMILVYEAAIPYCQKYKKDRVPLYEKKSMDLMKELLAFDAERIDDEPRRMTMSGISFR